MINTKLFVFCVVTGPPDSITISPTVTFDSGILLIGLAIDDKSPAPALALLLTLGDIVVDKIILFEAQNISIPVTNMYLHVVDESVEFIEAANYSLIVEAYNELGNYTVVNETVFIPGVWGGYIIECRVAGGGGGSFPLKTSSFPSQNFKLPPCVLL